MSWWVETPYRLDWARCHSDPNFDTKEEAEDMARELRSEFPSQEFRVATSAATGT